jgi:hypothetical protein
MARNFDCPETEQPCIDGRCTRQHCFNAERSKIDRVREDLVQKERIEQFKGERRENEYWERLLKRTHWTLSWKKKPKNSN